MGGLLLAAYQASHWMSSSPAPRVFRCDVEHPAGPAFGYEYRLEAHTPSEESETPADGTDPFAKLPPWFERGFRLDGGAELWSAAHRMVSVQGETPERVPRGIFSSYSSRRHAALAAEVRILGELLWHFHLIPSGILSRDVIGSGPRRSSVLLQRQEDPQRRGQWDWSATGASEVDDLGESILGLWERDRPRYDELVDILRGMDLVREVAIDIYRDPRNEQAKTSAGDVAAVLLDGTNLGLCSDGTLRITQMVLDLIRPDVSCLLIEEPETAVHPGLLDKLLALMESYSADRQIVLSTHSAQVVDRFVPRKLRLVERESGHTRVHALSAADRDLAIRYLRDQGSLSDFVFRRSDA